MNSNVLVTGGFGFIGSHFARLLHNHGYNIIILDKLTYAADKARVSGVDHRLFIGDICDKQVVQHIVKECDIDCIVNFAAETMVDRSIEKSIEFVKSNFEGVQVLLDICKENNENGKDIRLVQIGTDECYGSIEKGSFKETDSLKPRNPYSACKAGADLLCLSYVNTYCLDICITRSSNNYGQYQHKEKFIPKMITDAIHGKPLLVYGDGENVRDWLFVKDNDKAIRQVMENGKTGEIYNIGGGNELTNNQIAKIISDRFNVPIEYIEDRKGHDKRYSINCDKIKDELGWQPVKKFKEGLNDTIKWYIEEEKRKDLKENIE